MRGIFGVRVRERWHMAHVSRFRSQTVRSGVWRICVRQPQRFGWESLEPALTGRRDVSGFAKRTCSPIYHCWLVHAGGSLGMNCTRVFASFRFRQRADSSCEAMLWPEGYL